MLVVFVSLLLYYYSRLQLTLEKPDNQMQEAWSEYIPTLSSREIVNDEQLGFCKDDTAEPSSDEKFKSAVQRKGEELMSMDLQNKESGQQACKIFVNF